MAMKLNKKFPVMANTRPWNELVLRGKRTFKTLNMNWKYRGTIYLYDTRGKLDALILRINRLTTKDVSPGGRIVGTAKVVDVTDGGFYYHVHLKEPKRFRRPILFTPTPGSIRISRIR